MTDTTTVEHPLDGHQEILEAIKALDAKLELVLTAVQNPAAGPGDTATATA